jgi:urease accessory protein
MRSDAPAMSNRIFSWRSPIVSWLAVMVFASSPAAAHSGDVSGGFLDGFAHPLLGLDHVAAMIAVGLWGAFLGNPAMRLLPVIFPLVMAFGGAIAIVGMPVPGVETGIALSAVVLGAMIALAARPPIWIAVALVGAFAIFHGHAHGAVAPPGSDAVAFSLGFVMATGLLHLTGIAFGLLMRWPAGRMAVRGAGIGISLLGIAFLGQAI